MLIDTHTHTNFPQFKNDWQVVIQRALDDDIWLINVGTDLEMSKRAIEIAHKYENSVFASVGLHPNEALSLSKGDLNKEFDETEFLKLSQDKSVVAIGECGLDFYRTTNKEKQKIQYERLEKQIEIAIQAKKPLICHIRNAYEEANEILKKYTSRLKSVVIHSFTGNWQDAELFLNQGFYLSFNGIITFSHNLDEIVKKSPLDKILFETDAPYLTPAPFRGQRNEPQYVKYVAERVAEIKDISIEEVAGQTTKNAKEVFNLVLGPPVGGPAKVIPSGLANKD